VLEIKNGNVIDPVSGTIEVRDIFIQNGCIVSKTGSRPEKTIDASGFYVAPGLVDIHVHFRDPGYEYKEDIYSGALAAAAGGFTTVACMANTNPVLDSPELIEYVLNKSSKTDINVFPIAAVTKGQRGECLTDFGALKGAGACALSDDGVPVSNAGLMLEALRAAGGLGLIIVSHSEDAHMTDGRAVNEGSISQRLDIGGRPSVAEEYMVARDAMLAEYAGAGIHIAHVSTAGSVDIIREFKKRGVNISCETCPQYFTFTQEEVLKKGAMAKVFPPLRTERDREAVIAGLCDGTIDIIASDHAPHSSEEKALGLADAPGGMIGLETSLAAALSALYHTGRMPLAEIIRKMTVNPSNRLNLPAGGIAIGDRADLVIFDLDREWIVNSDKFHSKSRNTPFSGMKLKGRVEFTISGGKVVYQSDNSRFS
jgi:dihydroorotase